ncbi:MAG: GatB/YqeY domain-containing protein [Leptothrix sp. (in: b-proteobacteria)]
MNLKQRITEDMKVAMKAREAARLATIRLILAAVKQKEVDERTEVDDAAVLAILDKMVKQRRDSITQFDAAGRSELSAQERSEIEVIQTYLPRALEHDEVLALVAATVADLGASGPQDMARVMASLKPQLAGRADMGKVSGLVKAALTRA